MPQSKFQHYYSDFIKPNEHRIQSLYLIDPLAIDVFFSSTEHIVKYSGLQTLVLNEIDLGSVQNLLGDLNSLNNLSSLTIHIDHETNKITIYDMIFHLPVLKYCKLSFKEHNSLGSLPMCTNPSSTIEYFFINDNYNLVEVNSILSYIPKVRRLSIEYQYRPNPQNALICLILLNNGTYICVTGDRLELRDIEQFVKDHFQQIKVLHISSCTDLFNTTIRTQSLLSYLPHLYTIDYSSLNMQECRRILKIYQSIYDHNRASFPSFRQWFFTHELMSNTDFHTIFCSIKIHR